MANAVVFDVGGTKIAASVVDDNGRDVLEGEPRELKTPTSADAATFVETMANLYKELAAEVGDVVAWGAAFPGPYRRLPNGELQVFPRNVPGVRGHSIEAEMRKLLPDVPGFLDNDTKLAAWGEYLIGAIEGQDNSIGVVHGTGVSSALIVEGQLLRGPDNNAGEIACVVVERDPDKARPCDAQDGQAHGHLEGQIRGPALAEIFCGVDRHDGSAVRQALESVDAATKSKMIDHSSRYMALAIGPLLQALSTGHIVFFGGIANFLGDEYAEALTHYLAETSEEFRFAGTKARIAEQPRMSPLVAAAQFAFTKAGHSMKLNPSDYD